MADPTNPNLPDPSSIRDNADAAKDAADAFNTLNNMVVASGESFESLGTQLNFSGTQLGGVEKSASRLGSVIGDLESSMSTFADSLSTGVELSDKQSQALGLLSNKLLGTREAFNKLGAGIDSSRLSTLSGQWASLSDTILNSGGSISSIARTIKDKFGVELPDSVKKGGIASISDFMTTMMRATDNTHRLQNAIIQLSARAGNLGEVFRTAGPHLENMNELVGQQRKAMIDAAEATSLMPEQIEEYYSQLGTIPGALTRTVGTSSEILARGGSDAQGRVSMLSATILTAVGTGRQYRDVVDDLRIAFKDFGIVGEDALKFSTSISKVAQDNNVDLEAVQVAVRATADAFSRYADTQEQVAKMSLSLSQSMDQYIGALQKVGVPGNQAIGIYQNMTSAIANMTTAQKAFLSQQTGGPGGLMGAFQIERLLKTDPAAVLERVRRQIEQMTGPAVSVEEAAVSPAAAARLVRQREILKSGPLGQLVGTGPEADQRASQMLEAFREVGKGAKAPDFKDILKTPMERGIAIQEKSLTEVTKSRIALERIMAASDMSMTDLVESNFTAADSTNQALNDMKQSLRAGEVRGLLGGGRASAAYAGELSPTGRVEGHTGAKMMLDSARDIRDTINMFRGVTGEQIEKMKTAITKDISDATAKRDAAMTQAERSAAERTISDKRRMLDELDANQRRANAFTGATGYLPPGVGGLGEAPAPGTRVGAAATVAAAHLATTPSPATTPTGHAPIARAHYTDTTPVALGQQIDVNVRGICIQCGQAMDQHTASVNPAFRR